MIDDDDYDDEAETLRLDDLAKKRYHNQLMRHPDPRDPDYPELPEEEQE